MYVDQESYLITIYDTRFHYIELGDKFYIGPNYKDMYRIENSKNIPIKLLANSRIVAGQNK